MWHEMLERLGATTDLRVRDPAGRRPLRRPDVWLHDGHQGPLPVRGPVVAELHEATLDDPELRPLIDPAFVAAYEEPSRLGARQATRIITLSESSRRQVVAAYGVPEAHVVVVHLGVDRRVFHPDAADGSEAVVRAGGDASRPYVLYVSQLHPRKNYAAVREAMTRLVARGYPHALVLVGWGPADRNDAADIEREACADLPGTSGRVVRLSGLSESELAAVMAGASAFCLPSLMEGFGLPVLEAMACATPVVVSDRGALPEVVGDAGIVTAPTPDAVEVALEKILSDEGTAKRLGTAALERSARFTWEATAQGWLRVLGDAVASERR
jgi:alpha-1,3-rhamnosyl/mannosyltransferase